MRFVVKADLFSISSQCLVKSRLRASFLLAWGTSVDTRLSSDLEEWAIVVAERNARRDKDALLQRALLIDSHAGTTRGVRGPWYLSFRLVFVSGCSFVERQRGGPKCSLSLAATSDRPHLTLSWPISSVYNPISAVFAVMPPTKPSLRDHQANTATSAIE